MEFLKKLFEEPEPEPVLEVRIQDCENFEQLREAVQVITAHLGGGVHCENTVSFPENSKELFPNLAEIAKKQN